MSVQFESRANEILNRMNNNVRRALTAMGATVVEITTDYMQGQYGTPIYDTGDLQRDVNYKVQESDKTVQIGNSLEYAPWVHEGTFKVKARPYLRDAITQNYNTIQEVGREYLGNGFDN